MIGWFSSDCLLSTIVLCTDWMILSGDFPLVFKNSL